MTTSPLVPGALPCAIDGHAYLCNPDYERATVQVLRQQADTSPEAGEQTLNPQGLWRRSQESWHHGAGQDFLDGRHGASQYAATYVDPARFRSSKGADVWTKGQVSLLHPTLKTWATTNDNLYMAVTQAGSGIFALYLADGDEVYFAGLPFSLLNNLDVVTGTGWTASHATIAATSQWFTLTATSTSIISATSPTGLSGIPVDPGRQYAAAFLASLNAGAALTPTVAVTWYDDTGATISTTTPAVASDDDNPGVTVTTTPIAPTNAATASVTVSYTTAATSGDVHNIRAVSFGPYDDVVGVGFSDTWNGADINDGDTPAAVQSLATDGTWVWAALGISGIHRTTDGSLGSTGNVPDAPAGGQISLVGYANGFLLAAGSDSSTTRQNVLWSVDDPLGTPSLTVIKTHPNNSFIWTGISPGRNCIYAYGNSGGTGEVYKITIDPNTGGLSTDASFATYLPDGETIHALQFYAGTILMGTGRGVRIGQADGTGNIDYGPLVPTNWPVRCLEPQDRYCWFGWTKYDENTSGLGRIDLGFLTDTLTPAWASDLMTADTTAGDVVGAVTFAPYGYTENQRPPVRVFTVAGEGAYIEDPGSRVHIAELETGAIRFGTSEPKTTRSVDIRHHALPAGGSIDAELQRESSGSWEWLGSSSTAGSYGPATPLDALNEQAEAMEFRFTLNRPDPDGINYSQTVELTRWTAKVLPVPSTIDETFTLTLQMYSEVSGTDDQDHPIDVAAEIAFLKTLEQTRRIVELQLGSDTFDVYVLSSQFKGDHWNSPRREFAEGPMQIVCQTVRG